MWRNLPRLNPWLTIVAVVAGLLLLLIWFYPPSQDFCPHNPFWNGLKELAQTTQAGLTSAAQLPPTPPGTAALVIPYRSFPEEEMAELKKYVNQGGILVIADDFGYGNQLVSYLGLRARFCAQPLLDPLFNYKNASFPKVMPPQGEEGWVLNHATCLEHVSPAEIMASSSSFSFLDQNNNWRWDKGEPRGPFPLMANISLGRGRVILLADPSVFINSMMKVTENAGLISVLIQEARLFIYFPNAPPGTLGQLKAELRVIREFLISREGTAVLLTVVIIGTLSPLCLKRRRHG